ncbi:conserved hypothetical protein [Catenulispora acidiphila DSM 44928]|uniref:Uncharacterized protein n=1 Tax=Catenulispora acidiphila (strain DSM 44928 / JCM 14897 / NBRC 102108 / NRRL B-24433 / ID139908) TaxID=479433 RepID=C7QDH4_CATAD|nr:SCO2521 family protein [Catenulispora acidiphila]ACU72767.1 conserved hypothetical protein [Catenulispora acidiphila DSM 44928]
MTRQEPAETGQEFEGQWQKPPDVAGLLLPASDSGQARAPSHLFGVVSTALIQHSGALPLARSAEILRIVPQRVVTRIGNVQQTVRPVPLAWSAHRVAGIDSGVLGIPNRAILGTAVGRAVVYGGRIVQGSAWVAVVPMSTAGRRPWGEKLAAPGTAVVDDSTLRVLIDAPLSKPPDLGLTLIADRLVDDVQSSRRLDHVIAFRSAGDRLYWTAVLRDSELSKIHANLSETRGPVLHFTAPSDEPLDSIVRFCEDVARHKWLISTVALVSDRMARKHLDPAGRREVVQTVFDQLMHLWLPGSYLESRRNGYWTRTMNGIRLTQQWEVQVARLRELLEREE